MLLSSLPQPQKECCAAGVAASTSPACIDFVYRHKNEAGHVDVVWDRFESGGLGPLSRSRGYLVFKRVCRTWKPFTVRNCSRVKTMLPPRNSG